MDLVMMFVLKSVFLYYSVCLPIANSVTIQTDQTTYHGISKQSGNSNVSVFLGIPYAKPPIGSLRFQPPQELDIIKEIKAQELKPSCLQDKTAFLNNFSPDYGNTAEDCLYLNIYIPTVPSETSEAYQVLIWIHNGYFQYGSGNVFDGVRMSVENNAIIVTLNYRLGVLGFFSEGYVTGNAGLLDQNLAFKWVHQNILYFGGDPKRITLVGQGSGGTSVAFHVLSPRSQGLFSRAISHGGLYLSTVFNHDPKINSQILMALSFCIGKEIQNSVECLRKMDGEKLLRLTQNKDLFEMFMPTIGGDFFPLDPRKLYENQNYSKIPYLIGLGEQTVESVQSSREPPDMVHQGFLEEAETLARNQPAKITETLYYLLLSQYTYQNETLGHYSQLLKAMYKSEILQICKRSNAYLYSIDETSHSNEDEHIQSFPARFQQIWTSFSQTGIPTDPVTNLQVPQVVNTDSYLEIKPNSSTIKNITSILPEREQLLWFNVIPNILNLQSSLTPSGNPVSLVQVESVTHNHEREFEKNWGMTNSQVEGLLISVVLALLFVTVVCIGLIRMILQPPIYKPPAHLRHYHEHYNTSFTKHSYDNDAFSLTDSHRHSVASIELKESKE